MTEPKPLAESVPGNARGIIGSTELARGPSARTNEGCANCYAAKRLARYPLQVKRERGGRGVKAEPRGHVPPTGATRNYAFWVDAGAARFDGNIGFFSTAPVAQQAGVEDVTNNVTAGGTDGTIANYTDLVTYSNDAAAIRNDIYQLARSLAQAKNALRTYGLLS